MKYTFKTTEEKYNEGKAMVKSKGGQFYTDGTFEVSGVEGEINFKNSTLIVNITDKPWLASWEMIEENLNNFFNK